MKRGTISEEPSFPKAFCSTRCWCAVMVYWSVVNRLVFGWCGNVRIPWVVEMWSWCMCCVLQLLSALNFLPIELKLLSQLEFCCPFVCFFHPLFIFVSVSLPPPLFFPVSLCWAGGLYSRSAPRNNLFCDCGCIYYQGWRSSQQGQGGHHHRSRCVCCIQLIQQIWGHILITFLLVF